MTYHQSAYFGNSVKKMFCIIQDLIDVIGIIKKGEVVLNSVPVIDKVVPLPWSLSTLCQQATLMHDKTRPCFVYIR